MVKSDIFLRAAEHVAQRNVYSCTALQRLEVPADLAESYEQMFVHDVMYPPEGVEHEHCWWDISSIDGDNVQELRVMSLLLAHEMHQTGDL